MMRDGVAVARPSCTAGNEGPNPSRAVRVGVAIQHAALCRRRPRLASGARSSADDDDGALRHLLVDASEVVGPHADTSVTGARADTRVELGAVDADAGVV